MSGQPWTWLGRTRIRAPRPRGPPSCGSCSGRSCSPVCQGCCSPCCGSRAAACSPRPCCTGRPTAWGFSPPPLPGGWPGSEGQRARSQLPAGLRVLEGLLAQRLALPHGMLDALQLGGGGRQSIHLADESGQVRPVVVPPRLVRPGQLRVLHVDEGVEEGRDRPPPQPWVDAPRARETS